MNVCIDVGNTTIAVGFYENDKIIDRISTMTDSDKTEDEYASALMNEMRIRGLKKESVETIILSSVVPAVTRKLRDAINFVFNKQPMLIGPGTKTGLSIKVDNPSEIGNDLIADLVGAKEKYGFPCIIADLGTASKVLLLDKTGTFVSCLIVPGLSLSALSLSKKAALLPEASLETPTTILAKNTLTAMNAGIVYGHADMIIGLINRYEKEIGYPCKHILTGGGAMYIKDIVEKDFIYDPLINLNGLNNLIRRNIKL